MCSDFRKRNLHIFMPTSLVLLDVSCFNKFLKAQSPTGERKYRNVVGLLMRLVRAPEDSLQIDQALEGIP